MTRCCVCDAPASVVDERIDAPSCANCAKEPLAVLRRKLTWRIAADVDVDDRQHERRIAASERIVAALRHAVLAVLAACLSACSIQTPTAGDALLVAFLLFVFVALCAATERLLAALYPQD